MIEIEFRGKRVNNGEFVFGDLIHMTGGRIGIIFDKRVAAVEVKSDTVVQFLGHDSHGNEVYEGDKLTDSQGNTYIAKFDSVVEWQSNRTPVFRRAPFDFTKEFIELTVEAAS